MDPVGDGTPSKASPDRSVRIPNTNIEHLESPSTLESSPRKIAGWNLSLDLDSSDVEDLDDDNDADTMERSTCSTLEGVEVARPEPDIVESEKVMVQHQQPTTLGLCEHAWESVVDVDAKPLAHKTSPKGPTLRAATKKCHGNGTISDPICLDDNVFETSVERDLILKIGHPVYSPFPGTNPLHEEYYWGLVSAKTRGSDGKFLYCIDFDDGDKIGPPGIPSDHVYRMEEQIRLEVEGKLERTNLPRKYFDLWDSTRDAPPPIDWYKKSMSISPCASKKKAPPGDRLGPQALKCGNIVQSPKSKCNNPSTTEKKLEAHDVLCPSLTFEELFKRSCGSCHQCSSRLACGFCGGCLHNKDATTRRLPFQVCVQKMCLKLRLQEKCQHDALILPPEWYFGFDKESTNKKYRGLWIIKGKTAKKFRSFESAKHHAPSQFKDLKPENFYRHVGLASELPEIGTPLQSVASLSTREISPKCQSPAPPPSPNVEANQSWTLKELYERRCKVCDNCKREPCNYCHTCQHNIPVGCIRRMCDKIDDCQKRQPSEFLPKGWFFCFSTTYMRGGVTAKLDGLKIMAPNGIHFSSLESAIKENSLSFAFHRYAPQKFYNFVGITLTAQDIRALKRAANTSPPKKRQRLVAKLPGPSIIEVDCSTSEDENTNGSTGGRLAQHPLCGKSFYKEWLRLDGKKMFKTGKITNVANGNGKKGEDFTVEFSADCRNLVKEPSNRTLCSDSFMKIGCDDAWDGCFRSFDVMGTKPTQLLAKAPNLFERWETPNTYLRKMVPAEGTVIRGYHLLPFLQITYKGFLLKFSVKESDIDTTRFGVFLSAKPLFESNDLVDRFSLPAGHLLDFGVLAPFRTEDIRSDHEHLIKSIVHSCNNEKYCFLSQDKTFILDITDDMTSNLHSIARRHIPPFVNQISGHDGEPASVHARFDPEGALHYLLGHPTREQGDFVLIANGEEKEIFAHPQNYHDLAHIREKFSLKNKDDAGVQDILGVMEHKCRNEVNSFTSEEVDQFVKVYNPLISRDPPPTRSVLLRIIALAVLLKHRLDMIQQESMETEGKRCNDRLTDECEQTIITACHAWEMYHSESNSDFHREATASNFFRLIFSEIYPRDSMHTLTPSEFRDKICPHADMLSSRR